VSRTLQLEYLDLYLIHWPISSQPGKFSFPIDVQDLMPFDVKGVWEAMEECQKLGLTRAIGVSNFSVKKLENLFTFATIRPVVNQVMISFALFLFTFVYVKGSCQDQLMFIRYSTTVTGGDESCMAAKEAKRVLQSKWDSHNCILSSKERCKQGTK